MSNARNIARLLASNTGELLQSSIGSVPGSKITGPVGYGALPTGAVLQIKSTLYTWYNSTTIDNGWYNVPGLSVAITPKYNNSKIRVDVRWFGEVASAWDVVFGVTRNGTLISTPTQEGSRNMALGVPCQSYIADDNDSTPEFCQFSTIDSPATTSAITYQVVARAWSSRTLWTGRVMSGTSNGNYEQASTEIIVTEFAG